MLYDVKLKDDCIGKYKIYIYRLTRPVDRGIINSMEVLGDTEVFTNFPKPYFNIKSDYILIKGVIGNERIDVTYYEGYSKEKVLLENTLEKIT